MAIGDIGQHFPDADDTYRDIDSKILLKKVTEMMVTEGWYLGNLDATLILEEPKVSKYIPKMRSSIAALLKADVDDISIKATTTESLGPEGRGEGISAHAIVLIHKK
jgi:2-C-methyl-D-erythritol 2,4-cyclodiphosphate synthase